MEKPELKTAKKTTRKRTTKKETTKRTVKAEKAIAPEKVVASVETVKPAQNNERIDGPTLKVIVAIVSLFLLILIVASVCKKNATEPTTVPQGVEQQANTIIKDTAVVDTTVTVLDTGKVDTIVTVLK